MNRRSFLSRLALVTIGLPFMPKKSKAVAPLLVVIVLVIFAVMFWQLYKLCTKFLPNTPPPPPNKDGSIVPGKKTKVSSDSQEATIQIPVQLHGDYLFKCDQQTDDFLDPSGTGHYDVIMQLIVECKLPGQDWMKCHYINVWANAKYMCVQQIDMLNNAVVRFISDWQLMESLPALISEFPQSSQCLFRITSAN